MVPNCAEGGVLGVLCGIIGASQGIEGIKLIAGIGDPMIGRLGLYDGLEQRWMYVKVEKNPDCPVCGDNPTVTELIDYEAFCGMPAHDREEHVDADDLEILPTEYAEDYSQRPDVILIDVREPHEYEINRIEGSILIPKDQLPSRLADLDNAKTYVMQCKTGARSRESTELMRGAGFKAYNLWGGINAYARQVDPSIPTY
jgi:sulfur-carrier protein adenylyltransferase/sulfurtransferase